MPRRVICGSFHQGHVSSVGGFQCTAIALMALFLAHSNRPVITTWNSDVVNNIVIEGSHLYTQILLSQNANAAPRYLGHWELPNRLHYEHQDITVHRYEDILFGITTESDIQYDGAAGNVDIHDGLSMASQISLQVLATFGETTVAIFRRVDSDEWYMFDSHSRDRFGSLSFEGTASLIAFSDMVELVSFIRQNYRGLMFNLTPVLFEVLPSDELVPSQSNVSNSNCRESLFSENATSINVQHCQDNNTAILKVGSKRKNQNDTDFELSAYECIQNNNIFCTNYSNNTTVLDVESNSRIQNDTDFEQTAKIMCMQNNANFSTNQSCSMLEQVISSIPDTPPAAAKEKYVFQVDVDSLFGDEKKYEECIRERISDACSLCLCILFKQQRKLIAESIHLTCSDKSVSINEGSILCSRCTNFVMKGKLPPKCDHNRLSTGQVPQCISSLSVIEKRLIAQIQSYMTIIVLPGGQYAEKGLAIHFPLDFENYFRQIKDFNKEQYIIVHAPNHGSRAVSVKKVANFVRVRNALLWLKEHNALYMSYPNLTKCTARNNSFDESNNTIRYPKLSALLAQCPESVTASVNHTIPDVNVSDVISNTNVKEMTIPTKFHEPVWLSKVPHGEELAFPWLFPFGKGGIAEHRDIHLTTMDYFQQRLYNKDSRWRKNITYLMFSVNQMEQTKLSNEINIQMRLRKTSRSENQTQVGVTAGDLSSSETISPTIKKNSFMFMKNIRGTVAYWADILSNLLATVKSLGPPTLFITLSADDHHWPELKMMLENRTYSNVMENPLPNNDIRSDPLLTSLHFERRWKALFKYVINGKKKPLGVVEDYFVRVEYQNRGSPHLHIFLWIKDAPSFGKSTSNEIVTFIDRTISSRLPSKINEPDLFSLVKNLQMHSHTKTCKKTYTDCRFGFPRKITQQTQIITNANFTNNYFKGRFYETQRSIEDTYVNAYNVDILKRWRANMDIQMVSGVHGLAYYVCNYIAKAEPEDLKQHLCTVLHDIESQSQPVSLRKQLHLIGNCVLKSRRLSAQEAAARIGHLQFVWSSRSVCFINTRPEVERYKILLPKSERDKLPVDSTEIFSLNMIDYYVARPDELEQMSLFKFASFYKLSSSQTTCVSSRCQKRIKLKTVNKIMQLRRKPIILRTPKFSIQSENHFFSLLMLHLPFRKEDQLLYPYQNAKDAFTHKYNSFDVQDIHYESYLHDLERIMAVMRVTNSELQDIVAPNTCEDIPDTYVESISQEYNFLSSEQLDCSTLDISGQHEHFNSTQDIQFHQLQVGCISEHEVNENIASLTDDQQIVFQVIKKHFEYDCREPLRMFVSGGGGTGKTYLIRTVVEWLRIFTASFAGADPVMVCGPTGMSAKNIQGKTIHNALKLPVQHGYEPQYRKMSDKTLQNMRSYYRHIHTIVIDEISMVSNNILTFIHRRLCEIKQSSEYFGGVNIILIGDFFQLKPCRGQFAFKNTILWDLFDRYILQTNMRQIQQNQYCDLLNRVRRGLLLPGDIAILQSRLINNSDSNFDGVLRVYPTLKEVAVYNARQQDQLNLANDNFITITASHAFSSSDIGQENVCNVIDFIPQDDRDAGGLPYYLTLSRGTRIMLIRNIATEEGLVNGALGFVEELEIDSQNKVSNIFVSFDDKRIGRIFFNAEHNAIQITRISQEYYFRGRSVIRTQFPLIPAWACSIHKVQGLTCDRLVVSLGKTIFAEGQAYVALSRVKKLEGLGILSLNISKIAADEDVIKFYNTSSIKLRHSHT